MKSRTERRRRRHARATRRMQEAEELEELGERPAGASAEERCEPGEDAWPDLLHDVPLRPVGVEMLRSNLRFAFESGDADGALRAASEQAPVAASSFQSEGFASGLFLRELVDEVFHVEVDGERFAPGAERLRRLLSLPPDDARDRVLRQGELREQPALAASLGRAYTSLHRLRRMLDFELLSTRENREAA